MEIFEKTVERGVGLTIEQIRHMTLDELQGFRESVSGTKLKISWNNITLITREQINFELDRALNRI